MMRIVPIVRRGIRYENCRVEVKDSDGNTTQKIKLTRTRIVLGIVVFPGTYKFAYVHYCHPDDKSLSSVVIEIYSIGKDFYQKHSTFSVGCGFACGNFTGRVCRVSESSYIVVAADPTNYNFATIVSFDENSANKICKVNWRAYDNDDIHGTGGFYHYYEDSRSIYHSKVEGYQENNFHIRIMNLVAQRVIGEEYRGMIQGYRYNERDRLILSKIIEIRRKDWALIKLCGLVTENGKNATLVILFNILEGSIVNLRQVESEDSFTIEFSTELPSIGYLQVNAAESIDRLLAPGI